MYTYASIHIDIILEKLKTIHIIFFSLRQPALDPVGRLPPGHQDRRNHGQSGLWHRLPTLPRHRRPVPPRRWKRSWQGRPQQDSWMDQSYSMRLWRWPSRLEEHRPSSRVGLRVLQRAAAPGHSPKRDVVWGGPVAPTKATLEQVCLTVICDHLRVADVGCMYSMYNLC